MLFCCVRLDVVVGGVGRLGFVGRRQLSCTCRITKRWRLSLEFLENPFVLRLRKLALAESLSVVDEVCGALELTLFQFNRLTADFTVQQPISGPWDQWNPENVEPLPDFTKLEKALVLTPIAKSRVCRTVFFTPRLHPENDKRKHVTVYQNQGISSSGHSIPVGAGVVTERLGYPNVDIVPRFGRGNFDDSFVFERFRIDLQKFSLSDEFVEVSLRRTGLKSRASDFDVSKNSRSRQSHLAFSEKLEDQLLAVLFGHITRFSTGRISSLESDMFACIHAVSPVIRCNCTISCKPISVWGTVVTEYDGYRRFTRAAGRSERAWRRPPGSGHDHAMTDSAYSTGALNPTERTNGHTITGSPRRDRGIDWEQVRAEVGE